MKKNCNGTRATIALAYTLYSGDDRYDLEINY